MTPNIERLDTLHDYDIAALMLEPLEVQASTIDARVRKIERINRTIYAELGGLILYFEERRLFSLCFDEKGERFKSMESWLVSACPYSRSYALEAKAKMKVLRDSGTPMDKLLFVPRCNIQLLAQLPAPLQRDEEVLKDASLLEEDAFRSKIIREHPEAHIDTAKRFTFRLDGSAAVKVGQALTLAMQIEDTQSKEIALEAICAAYILEHEEDCQPSNIGHREAHA